MLAEITPITPREGYGAVAGGRGTPRKMAAAGQAAEGAMGEAPRPRLGAPAWPHAYLYQAFSFTT